MLYGGPKTKWKFAPPIAEIVFLYGVVQVACTGGKIVDISDILILSWYRDLSELWQHQNRGWGHSARGGEHLLGGSQLIYHGRLSLSALFFVQSWIVSLWTQASNSFYKILIPSHRDLVWHSQIFKIFGSCAQNIYLNICSLLQLSENFQKFFCFLILFVFRWRFQSITLNCTSFSAVRVTTCILQNLIIDCLEYSALPDDVMKDFKLWELILGNNDPSYEAQPNQIWEEIFTQ